METFNLIIQFMNLFTLGLNLSFAIKLSQEFRINRRESKGYIEYLKSKSGQNAL